MSIASLVIPMLLAAAAPPAVARLDPLQEKAAAEVAVERFPELALEVRLPASLVASRDDARDALLCTWKGTLGSTGAELTLSVVECGEYGIEEPEDANETWIEDLREPGAGLSFGLVECLPVEHGWARHVALARGGAPADGEHPAKTVFLASGLLEQHAWTLRAELAGEPDPAAAEAIRAALTGAVVAEGPPRDVRWSDEELSARWLRAAPEGSLEKLAALRTEHYAVLTDDSHGPALAKKLEALHASFAKLLAIPEVPSRKLLPVYLFRTDEEYQAYFAAAFEAPIEEAQWRRGHHEGIYYVTYFEDLDAPIHLYHAAQQILHARLRLDGGGAWFQAGIPEYLSTRPAQRKKAAKSVAAREHIPLAEILSLPELTRVTEKEARTGVDDVERRFEQTALWIEFLAESAWAKGRFAELARAVGVLADDDVAGVESALRAVYGVGIEEIERKWIDYCKKR